jgi:transposase
LSEAQWGAIGPLLPKNQPGARRTDDRRVISGIVHVLKTGCRWQDCPSVYGPPTTVSNRFRRWTMRGIWARDLGAGFGVGYLTRWRAPIPAMVKPSTARRARLTARRRAEKKQMFKKMYGRQASPSPNGRVRNFIDADPAQC